MCIWRRERDSNPRRAFDPYTLSRGAPSTTRPSLRGRKTLLPPAGRPARTAARHDTQALIGRKRAGRACPAPAAGPAREPRAHELAHRVERRVERLGLAAPGLREVR